MGTSSGSSSGRSFWALLKEELRRLRFPTWTEQDNVDLLSLKGRSMLDPRLICSAANCNEPGTEAACRGF